MEYLGDGTGDGMSMFEKQLTERVVSELKKRKIKQIQLLTLCKEIGMPISQPDISKIYSQRKALNIYQLSAVCKALKMPVDYFVWGEDRHREDFCDTHNSKTLHDSGTELECYAGRYYFYYLSTAAGEDKILKGKLAITEDEDFGKAYLDLNTGEKDREGKRIIKKYSGRILVSSTLGGAYLIFKNESIGEICMVCLRHRNYSVKDVECRIGLALVMGAGESKEPTVHRTLLIRQELADEQLEELRPWLCLIHDNICIERDNLRVLLERERELYPEYGNQIIRIGDYTSRDMVTFSSEALRRQLRMGRKEFVDFLSVMYQRADIEKNYKISQSDDILLYEKLETFRESPPSG